MPVAHDDDPDNANAEEIPDVHVHVRTEEGEDTQLWGSATSLSATVLYRYRWFILVLYSMTGFVNVMIFLSLFTISAATSKLYNISPATLVLTSTAGTLFRIFAAFFSARFLMIMRKVRGKKYAI